MKNFFLKENHPLLALASFILIEVDIIDLLVRRLNLFQLHRVLLIHLVIFDLTLIHRHNFLLLSCCCCFHLPHILMIAFHCLGLLLHGQIVLLVLLLHLSLIAFVVDRLLLLVVHLLLLSIVFGTFVLFFVFVLVLSSVFKQSLLLGYHLFLGHPVVEVLVASPLLALAALTH